MTVMPGKMLRPSGAWLMPSCTSWWAGTPARSRSWKRMRPLVRGRRPEMVFRVVVLPAPLPPMRVTISPASTCSEMPLSASTLP